MRGLYFMVQEPSGYMPEIDRVVPRRKPREVADHLHFADFREVLDFGAHVPRAQRRRGIDRGHVEIGQLIALLARRTASRTADASFCDEVRADLSCITDSCEHLRHLVHIRALRHLRAAQQHGVLSSG